jgi:pimeloyl-ACP methyl ester carboxylesterase
MATLKTSGYAPINGLNIYYEIHGEGKMPLVLIHGGGSTIETTFGQLLPLLAPKTKVIAVELQAHGRTNDRDAPETFEQDAEDVAGLLNYLGVTKANILGFSNGGTTTLHIAGKHAQLVNKIVVIAGAYKRDGFFSGFFDFMQNASIDNMPQGLKDAYLNVNPNQDGLLNMFNKDKARMINFKDYSDDLLKAIKAEALFMVADKDVITVAHTAQMSHLVAGAQLIVLPGSHGAFIGEAGTAIPGSKLPGIAVDLIEEFLRD